MPYNSTADSFHTKKLCSRLSSSKVRFYSENGRYAFLRGRRFRSNVRWSSQAHWKARSGLPISVKWTFFARCYSWGAMSEYRFKIGDFAPMDAGWPKISGRRVALTNHSSQKTRLNDLAYGIKIWTDLSSILSPSMCLTDRQTDRQTDTFLIARVSE